MTDGQLEDWVKNFHDTLRVVEECTQTPEQKREVPVKIVMNVSDRTGKSREIIKEKKIPNGFVERIKVDTQFFSSFTQEMSEEMYPEITSAGPWMCSASPRNCKNKAETCIAGWTSYVDYPSPYAMCFETISCIPICRKNPSCETRARSDQRKVAKRSEYANLLVPRNCSWQLCGKLETPERRHFKCSRCKVAYYCSKKCQRNHWRDTHKDRCAPKK
jgi:hypothetical protein